MKTLITKLKTSFISLIIITLFNTGCKKTGLNQNNSSPTPKTYLLSNATYSSIPAGLTYTEKYTYDSQNRVISFATYNSVYQYTYDNNNNLLTVKTYDVNGTLTSLNGTDKYSYSGNTVTVNTFFGDGSSSGSYAFTLNAKQQVAIFSGDNSEIQYIYDSNGNATSYVASGAGTQSDYYTYDSKKNPLSMVGAINLHLIYLAKGVPLTNVNNVLVGHANPMSYTYSYNSDGFPVSAKVSTYNGNGLNIIYTYITK